MPTLCRVRRDNATSNNNRNDLRGSRSWNNGKAKQAIAAVWRLRPTKNIDSKSKKKKKENRRSRWHVLNCFVNMVRPASSYYEFNCWFCRDRRVRTLKRVSALFIVDHYSYVRGLWSDVILLIAEHLSTDAFPEAIHVLDQKGNGGGLFALDYLVMTNIHVLCVTAG